VQANTRRIDFDERADRRASVAGWALEDSSAVANEKGPHGPKGENMSRLKSKRGQGLVEYILGVTIIAVVVIGGMRVFGTKTKKAFVQAGDTVEQEMLISQVERFTSGGGN
jgi:Flp pilus assembly pilin Flp